MRCTGPGCAAGLRIHQGGKARRLSACRDQQGRCDRMRPDHACHRPRCPTPMRCMSEKAGVELGMKGEVVVDGYSRTSAPHIYAIGDVTDRLQLTPVAIHEAMCFVETAFKDNPTRPITRMCPRAVFTTPEIGGGGHVGGNGAGAPAIPSTSTNPPSVRCCTRCGGRDGPDVHEDDGGFQDRQSAGLPHLRRPRRRDHPARRRRAEAWARQRRISIRRSRCIPPPPKNW